MKISVCAVTYKMEREWPRTEYTIWHQTRPPNALLCEENNSPSPCAMMNWVVKNSQGEVVVCLLDGARMLSPGVLYWFEQALTLYPNGFAYVPAFHLGPVHQSKIKDPRIAQKAENKRLASVDWKKDGYQLFKISTPVWDLEDTLWDGLTEATCFAMRREAYLKIGGYDERFTSPGGGFCNLEFFKRAQQVGQPVCILGEATFHQFHGGVSANAPPGKSLRPAFEAEYKEIFGEPYKPCWQSPVYLGKMQNWYREGIL